VTPYAARHLPAEDMQLLAEVRQAVRNLPDGLKDTDGSEIEVTCHMLARAVGRAFNLEWKDGCYVLPSYTHSWVVTPNGNIIDPYPIGTLGGPLLVDARNGYLASNMYIEIALLKRVNFNDPAFRRQTAVVHRELKRAIKSGRRLPI
jgi:hypothetical protein